MAPAKSQHYTIRGPGTAFNLVHPECNAQRTIGHNHQPNPITTPFPMSLSPSYHDERNVHRALQVVAPELDVERVEKLPTARIQTLYNISLTDGRSMVLTGPPEADSKQALRSEERALTVEAAAVAWLASLPSQDSQPSQQGNHIVYGGCQPGRDIVNYTGDSVNVSYVSQFIPKLYKFSPKKEEPPIKALALWEPTQGMTIAQLGRQLTEPERNSVDFQTGQLFRRLACHISPTGNFGPISHILRMRSSMPVFHAMGILLPSPGEDPPSDIGRDSWSACFKGYMEEVASDLGDFYIQMRFDVLMKHYHRFKHLLDKVEVSRLVAIQGANDSNVMVSIPGETDLPATGGWVVKKSQSSGISRRFNTKGEASIKIGRFRLQAFATGAFSVLATRSWRMSSKMELLLIS